MKKSSYIHLFIVLFLVTACKKQVPVENLPTAPEETGNVVLPGIADGSAKAEKVIGAAGGSLSSSDGALTVIIPKDALTANQALSIQRISNTNPLGKAKGYRIMPHDVQFHEPVQLVFHYEKAASSSTLGIAYQDSKGVWQAVGGALVDSQRKTVTVSTRHFSDWALFDCLYMIPETGTVQPGQSIELRLYTVDELLAPLVDGQEKPISKPMKTADQYVKKWQLIGPGELDSHGAVARYHAPDGLPDQTHITINTELDLGIKGKYILVTTIEILYSAVRLKHNQHQEVVYKSASALVQGDQVIISAGNGDGLNVVINWQGGLGLHPFTEPQAQFGWLPGDGSRYLQQYTDEITHQDKASGGGITVTDMGLTDGYVKGTFEISPIGKIGETSVTPAGTVRGTFQVELHGL